MPKDAQTQDGLLTSARKNWQLIVAVISMVAMFVTNNGEIANLKVQANSHEIKDETNQEILVDIRERIAKLETTSDATKDTLKEINVSLKEILVQEGNK